MTDPRKIHLLDQMQAGVEDIHSIVKGKLADLDENKRLADAYFDLAERAIYRPWSRRLRRELREAKRLLLLSDEKCGLSW